MSCAVPLVSGAPCSREAHGSFKPALCRGEKPSEDVNMDLKVPEPEVKDTPMEVQAEERALEIRAWILEWCALVLLQLPFSLHLQLPPMSSLPTPTPD